MNRWLLIALNVALLGLIVAAIPVMMKGREPFEENSRGVDALHAKQYDQAISLLKGAVDKKPENKDFRHNLLAAYNSKALHMAEAGKPDDALAAYEQALGLSPDDQILLKNYISALNNLGVSQSNERKFVEAQGYFEKASSVLSRLKDETVRGSIRENYSALLTLWGTEMMKRNQVSDSKKALAQAIELDAKNGVALVSLGDLAYEANDYAAAAKNYKAAVPHSTENKEYLTNRIQMIEDESKLESRFHHVADDSKRFLVQYVQYNGGTTVSAVLKMLNEAYDIIGRDLGVYPARAVNVKIYTQEDFFKVAKLPEWAIGIFDGKMRLRVDEVQSAPALVRDLLFHEYTHAVLAMNVKQEVPAWFHEGIAQLMEPQFRENSREQEQVRMALTRHQISFEQLEDSFKEITNKGTAENAYLMSKYFLTHLNRKYGHDKLREWVTTLTKDEPFSDAFKKVYRTDLKTAQENWIKSQVK